MSANGQENRSGTELPQEKAGDRVILAAILVIGPLLWLAAVLTRPLSPREAGILLALLDEIPVQATESAWRNEIERGWAWATGVMERSSRTLSLITFFGGTAALAFFGTVKAGNVRRTATALALAVACPVLAEAAAAIGGSGAAFLIALLLSMPLRWTGMPLRAVASVVLATTAILPFALAHIGAAALLPPDPSFDPMRAVDFTARFLIGDLSGKSSGQKIVAAVLFLVVAGMAAAKGRGKAGLIDALAIVGLFASTAATGAFGLRSSDPRDLAAAFLVPVLLFAALPSEHRTRLDRAMDVVVIALFLLSGLIQFAVITSDRAVAQKVEPPSWAQKLLGSTDPKEIVDRRATLDWIHRNVDPGAWLVLPGRSRLIDRYYERVGHRTGLQSALLPEEISLDGFASRAVILKPPFILVIDDPGAIVAALERRYELMPPPDDAPEGVTILRRRR